MKVTFSEPFIQNMSGKLSKDSNLYYMTRNGQTYLCHRNPTRLTTPTQAMLNQQERFKQMQTIVNEIMSTSLLKQHYKEAYKKQKKYTTLRGYIAHCVSLKRGLT